MERQRKCKRETEIYNDHLDEAGGCVLAIVIVTMFIVIIALLRKYIG